MRRGAVLALAMALLLGGCWGRGEGKCPKPALYDDKTLNQIQAAIEALPKDSILRLVLQDYEQERDDLRFCK